MTLPKEVAEAVLGTALQPLLQQRMAGRNQASKSQISKPQIEYRDLEMHRVVGTGQFGMVRVVRHIPTNQAYALKVRHAKHKNFITVLTGFVSVKVAPDQAHTGELQLGNCIKRAAPANALASCLS